MHSYLNHLLNKAVRIWKRRHKGKFPSDGTMFCILNFDSKRGIRYCRTMPTSLEAVAE